MKNLTKLLCMIVVLGTVSIGFALDPILMGNFEDGSTGSCPGDRRWDGWMINCDSEAVIVPAQAATRETHSLKWVDMDGGAWLGSDLQYPYGDVLDEKQEAWLNPGSAIVVDVTALSSEVEDGWVALSLFYNTDAPSDGWGFDDSTWQDVIIDGTPHTYVFYVTDQIRTVIQDSIDNTNWGCNLGFGMRSSDNTSTTIYLDNIWIYPDGPTAHLFPHDPSVEQDFNVDPDYVDLILKWKAAADPGDPNRLPDPNVIYAVHPDIVDEYIFMANAAAADANLIYVGATGIDPGTDDPNSEYGPIDPLLEINSVYRWAVVEAMDGYAHNGTDNPVLTVGVSKLDDVDPNNIIGPTWVLQTLSTIPVIDVQPQSTRFGVDDASVQFTIEVTSNTTPLYQWFYSLDAEIDPGDNPIASGTSDTLTITNHNKAYQAYFYCRVANAATVSGSGTEPDVYSNVVSLVVERKVAEYLFDGDLTDSGDGNDGTGINAPGFAAGVDGGSALSLDGSTQYVEIGDSGDPNTFNKCFPRADLFTDTEDGFGGGLDIGSITCWVKLDATVADQVSPILANDNGGWPITGFHFEILTDAAAANTNLRSYIWGEADNDNGDPGKLSFWMDVNPVYADPFNMGGDSQWHMLAATWDMNGSVKSYLDGNLLADWDAGSNVFSVWDNTMTIGFDGTNYFDGQIDNLRIYNYGLTAEEIVDEYGEPGCIYDFAGSNHNSNQLGSSYCKLDLADFADLAAGWLNDGFYTPVP